MRNISVITMLITLVATLGARPTWAEEAPDATATRPAPTTEPASATGPATGGMPAFLLGARAGALFGQPFSTLGSSVIGELAAEYHPSWWQRRLGLVLAASYSQPSASQTVTDPRLTQNGGTGSYTERLRDLGLSLGVSLWYPVGRRLLPYGSVGGTLHLYRNDVKGDAGAGAPFGENQEPRRRLGFVGRLGLGIRLGPGALTGDVTLDYFPVGEVITGDSNAGDLVASLGYMLFL